MPMRIALATFLLALLLSPIPSRAENVRYYEQNGVTYCETRQTVDERVPETRLEQRTETVYRTEPVTETREMTRVYLVPVTQYVVEAYWVGRWNPFVEPRLAYRTVPQTHWEQRSEQVKLPVTTYRQVPETRTVQTPVTSYRTVQKEVITRIAVTGSPTSTSPASVGPTAPLVAQRPQVGGIRRLDNDPPRYGVSDGWHAAGTLR